MRFSRSTQIPVGRALVAIGLLLHGGLVSPAWAEPRRNGDVTVANEISFDRDVRPILSNHCWKCHGPDAQERKAGLRLDQRESAIKPAESGKSAIVPKKPNDSELLRRVLSSDSDELMPPASENKTRRSNSLSSGFFGTIAILPDSAGLIADSR